MSLSRRLFLKRAGALAATACAGPLILPRLARGQSAPNARIGVGFIGTGRQGYHVNIPPFLSFPETQVVAVCDVDSWRLDQAKQRVDSHYAAQSPSGASKGCAAYRDFRELLARPDIDAVVISTPDHWHVPMAIAAIEAGKDVCLEKPLTRSVAEGRRLADLVAKHKRVFRTDSEYRSSKFNIRAVELARNGYLGNIHTLSTGTPAEFGKLPRTTETQPVPPELDFDTWLGPAPLAPYTEGRVHPRHELGGRPGWMRIRDYCDGMILNWGTHLNDIAQWGNNTDRTGPVEVEAHGIYPPEGEFWNVLTWFEAEYRYASGVRLRYRMSYPHVRFEGDEGWVEVARTITCSNPALLKQPLRPSDTRFPVKSDKRDFVDAILSRGSSMEDAEVGHRTASLCHIAHIAIQVGGKKLPWDPETEQFPGHPEANRLLQRPPARSPYTLG